MLRRHAPQWRLSCYQRRLHSDASAKVVALYEFAAVDAERNRLVETLMVSDFGVLSKGIIMLINLV